jgi:hypothetical protein
MKMNKTKSLQSLYLKSMKRQCVYSSVEYSEVALLFKRNNSGLKGSRDSSVGIATSYGLDDRGVGVLVPVWSRILSSPRRPDRLWGRLNLLSSGYRVHFPRGKAAGA